MRSTRLMLLAAVLGLIVFAFIGWRVTRPDGAEADIAVAASPEQVRLMFTSPEALKAARQRHDPTYRAVATGKRDTMQWTSEHHGAGTLKLTVSPAGDRVEYVRRVAGLELTFNGVIRLVQEGSGTRVTATETPARATNRTEQALFDANAEATELKEFLVDVKTAAEAPPPPEVVPTPEAEGDAGSAAPPAPVAVPDAG